MTKTIIEPFKIKSVEPINFTTHEYHEKALKEACYNLFLMRSESVHTERRFFFSERYLPLLFFMEQDFTSLKKSLRR
jgi:hypothetical protein